MVRIAVCSVNGCESEVYYLRLTLCSKHYYRWKRWGDPTVVKRIETPGTPYERMMARSATSSSGCLVVDGPLTKAGYVLLRWEGERLYGHRIAWECIHGPIPAGLTVDHLCRIRNCVNVEHMELVPLPVNASRASRPDPTKCGSGVHEWVGRNIYEWTRSDGRTMKACRPCRNEKARSRRQKKAGSR